MDRLLKTVVHVIDEVLDLQVVPCDWGGVDVFAERRLCHRPFVGKDAFFYADGVVVDKGYAGALGKCVAQVLAHERSRRPVYGWHALIQQKVEHLRLDPYPG